MKVLLVEPDKVLGEATAAAFEAAGLEVMWRRNGQKALDTLDESVPDAIVLEIQLGLHNGIEMLYEIRSYPEWQNIPVILYTLNAKILDETFTPALKQLGVIEMLYKPRITTKQLVKTVQSHIARTV